MALVVATAETTTAYYSPFFYTKLLSAGNEGVHRWMQNKKLCDILLFPVNVPRLHWCIVVCFNLVIMYINAMVCVCMCVCVCGGYTSSVTISHCSIIQLLVPRYTCDCLQRFDPSVDDSYFDFTIAAIPCW
jgi:Ulp1 family protease